MISYINRKKYISKIVNIKLREIGNLDWGWSQSKVGVVVAVEVGLRLGLELGT